MYMKVLNRRLRGNPVPGGSPLWRFFLPVPTQQSVLIYDNGDVWEKQTFSDREINDPSVYMFILGGTDFRCQEGSFEYEAMLAQGYEFERVFEVDEYRDEYTEEYL